MSNVATKMRTCIAFVLVAWIGAGHAAPVELHYDSFDESKQFVAPLTSASPIRMSGTITNPSVPPAPVSIRNDLSFVAGSTSMSLAAGWLLAPTSNRTTGVNIDLLDAMGNVIATDSFLGTVDGVARSTLTATALTAGAFYRIEFSGASTAVGRYQLDIVDGGVPPQLPSPAPAIPSAGHFLFDTHRGDKIALTTVHAGDALTIDGSLVPDRPGEIVNRFTFRTDGGPLSAGIEWIVADPSDSRRITGVNVDLLDAFDMAIASDSFRGVFDGEAFSQFSMPVLGAGTYTLVFTGAGINGGGRYRVNLLGSATPPGFEPIDVVPPPTNVPEPGSGLLLTGGLLALCLARHGRRRGAHVSRSSAAGFSGGL